MRNQERLRSGAIEANNEVTLTAIAKIAAGTVNKLATDNSDILYSPANIKELEKNTTMLDNMVAIKIKNTLVQN